MSIQEKIARQDREGAVGGTVLAPTTPWQVSNTFIYRPFKYFLLGDKKKAQISLVEGVRINLSVVASQTTDTV